MSIKNSAGFLRERRSQLILNSDKKIQLKISERLQTEVLYLCSRINSVEWSGTLFYRIEEGGIDQEKCTIVAEFVYLQNIGTSTYTEYEFGSEYFKLLMEHPELMDMKQGHIHSHQHMQVFFSGTDNAELIDNAPNHNYYLSLIVNNANEMCANLAYQVKEISTINSTVVKYFEKRNELGELVKSESVETIVPSEKIESVVYYYECDIIKPSTVLEIEPRYTSVRAAIPVTPVYGNNWTPGTYGKKGGSLIIPVYDENIGIFDNDNPKELNKKEKRLLKGELEQMDIFDYSTTEPLVNKKGLTKIKGKDDLRINSFMIALLSTSRSEKNLNTVIDRLDTMLDSKPAIDNYVNLLENMILSAYIAEFTEDTQLEKVSFVIDRGVELLQDYSNDYYHLVFPISKELKQLSRRWKTL